MSIETIASYTATAWKCSDIWSRNFSWVLASDLRTTLFMGGEHKKICVPKGTVWQSVVEFRVIEPFSIKTYLSCQSELPQIVQVGTTLRAQPAYSNKKAIAQHPYVEGYGIYVPLQHLELTEEYHAMFGL